MSIARSKQLYSSFIVFDSQCFPPVILLPKMARFILSIAVPLNHRFSEIVHPRMRDVSIQINAASPDFTADSLPPHPSRLVLYNESSFPRSREGMTNKCTASARRDTLPWLVCLEKGGSKAAKGG